MATRKVLITGASGNIGTALLRAMAAADDADGADDVEVVAVARRVPPPEPPYDTATWHALDITDPAAEPKLTALLDGVDAVVHLVWAFQPTRDEDYLERVGPDASVRVLTAAERAGVAHFVHMSSVGAYAPRTNETPVDEAYPHTGMPTSIYSVHKARFEAHLDDYERDHPDGMTVARVRPGIVLQHDAGAALSRYGLPAYLPARFLRALPLLPLDRSFAVPVVHSDDVADAVVRILQRRAGGAFNIAADEPMTRADVAAVFDARPVHVPAPVLRGAVALSWRLHLQPLSAGWLDLAFAVPRQDSTRAQTELGWQARTSPRDALSQTVDGMSANAGTASAALRPRSVVDRLRALTTRGPVSVRKRP